MGAFLVKLWQALVSGLSIGSIYALIAEGYYITFITTGALNFGQGEFLMIGALFGLTCYVSFGLPYALAVFAAVLLTAAMGVGLERVAIRPVMRHALSLSWVLSTVAVSIILKNAAVQLWGPEQIKFPSPFGEAVVLIGSAGIFPQELFIIVAALGTVFAVQVFLRRSLLGKALIAVAYNRNAAAVMGINVNAHGGARLRAVVGARRARRHPDRADHLRLGLHGHDARHQGVCGGDLRRP